MVCDARDNVGGLTWAGDVVSNTGSSFSSLGKILEKDLVPANEFGLPMKSVATFVAIEGNVVSLMNVGGTLVSDAGKDVWTGMLSEECVEDCFRSQDWRIKCYACMGSLRTCGAG